MKLDSAVAAAGAGGAFVQDLTAGTVLYADNADNARVPASVEKLYTTATALRRFGPAARLVTRVLLSGELDAEGAVSGDLILRGAGDPTLDRAAIARLARMVRRAGVRHVQGSVIGDESQFDTRRGGPRTFGAYDYDIGGVLGALTVDRGFSKGAGPGLGAARAFVRALRHLQITVTGRTRTGAAPKGARSVARVQSPTIAEIARRTNQPSDNFYAETLVKDLGASFGEGGTTSDGAAVVRDEMRAFGIGAKIIDGSGLARGDRTSPKDVVRLLAAMHDSPLAPQFEASLAVAGVSGTLRKRLRGTAAAGACRGKTGTLDRVSGLSGLCVTASGHTIAFAILMNDTTVWRARELQDAAVSALARYSSP